MNDLISRQAAIDAIQGRKRGMIMDWVYERLDKLVESGEMTEEEARREYREYKEAQIEEYMNDEQF